MNEMTFEEFIRSTGLPSTAKDQLPGILTDKTKKKLLIRPDAEEIISAAIEEINNGSVETVEALMLKKLK